MARTWGIAPLAALTLAMGAPSATASIPLGQVAPGIITSCSSSFEFLQTSTPDNAYVMPAAGEITSWTHRSQTGAGQAPTLQIYRKVADPATFQVVGHDGPEPIAANTTKTFPASVAVKAGDVIGLTGAGGANIGCEFAGAGETGFHSGNLTEANPPAPFTTNSGGRINLSAVLNPTNAFTLGGKRLNKKKGTATVTVTVPNPGRLIASGSGVKGGAGLEVTAAGEVKLPLRAKGKKRRTLSETGKVKLKVTVTYTPTGGDALGKPLKVKLKRN